MAEKLTQCDMILRHLQDFGSISSLEAIGEYGILRLASRINDLRKRGYAITSTTKTVKNRYNETTHYSVYKLADGGNNGKYQKRPMVNLSGKITYRGLTHDEEMFLQKWGVNIENAVVLRRDDCNVLIKADERTYLIPSEVNNNG